MAEAPSAVTMDKIVSLCKRRGFVFPGSEIYGGLANSWDYGPMGVELKRNVKEAWWRDVVRTRDDVVGLDAAILMNPSVWEASGHLAGFTDPLVECKECKHRFRSDHILSLVLEGQWWPSLDSDLRNQLNENQASSSKSAWDDSNQIEAALKRWSSNKGAKLAPNLNLVKYPEQVARILATNMASEGRDPNVAIMLPMLEILAGGNPEGAGFPCPDCGGELGESRQFNLMLKTFLGAVEDTASTVFMRPETAQGMFVNFLNIQTATRKKLPFGIAQIGKSFRNEITPGNFIFRTREFEQMEMEFFVKPPEHLQPGERNDDEWHEYWVKTRFEWYLRHGIRKENLRLRVHETAELAHYAKATTDIEYLFPWGWGEMEGIANRTDFDLKKHSEHSGTRLTYFDDQSPSKDKHYHPYVIEPAVGVDRLALMFLLDAYTEEEVGGNSAGAGKGETRVVLKFHPSIAPVQVALLPLSRNEKLTPLAREVYASLMASGRWNVEYDDAQSIGRRYRRFDEVGTPFCVTVDFDSLEDNQVTIRDRDTLIQDRVAIADLASILGERLG